MATKARAQVKPAAKAAPKFKQVDPRTVEAFDKSSESDIAKQLITPKEKIDRSQEDHVQVMVPKMFRLTDDDHSEHLYNPGVQSMPLAHAEHWFAQTAGVEII